MLLLMILGARATTFFRQGNELLRSGRVDEAIGAYTAAIDEEPRHFGAHANLGAAHAGLRHYAAAADAYAAALALHDNGHGGGYDGDAPAATTMAAVRMNLGAAQAQLGRHAEAARSMEAALRQAPVGAGAHVGYYNIALAREAAAAATVAAATAAAAATPGEGRKEQQLLLRQAADAYRIAVSLQPAFGAAHTNLALLLHGPLHGLDPGTPGSRAANGAMYYFRAAASAEPHSVTARFNLGHALLRSGRMSCAAAQLRCAARLLCLRHVRKQQQQQQQQQGERRAFNAGAFHACFEDGSSGGGGSASADRGSSACGTIAPCPVHLASKAQEQHDGTASYESIDVARGQPWYRGEVGCLQLHAEQFAWDWSAAAATLRALRRAAAAAAGGGAAALLAGGGGTLLEGCNTFWLLATAAQLVPPVLHLALAAAVTRSSCKPRASPGATGSSASAGSARTDAAALAAVAAVAATNKEPSGSHGRSGRGNRVFRVGLLSSDWGRSTTGDDSSHPVMSVLRGVLPTVRSDDVGGAELMRRGAVGGISRALLLDSGTGCNEGTGTGAFGALCLGGASTVVAAARVRALQLHAVVELHGHTQGERLDIMAALRSGSGAARDEETGQTTPGGEVPLRVSYLGFLSSLGDGDGAAVDAFLADVGSAPPLEYGLWPHFAERLALLPRGMSLFPPPPPPLSPPPKMDALAPEGEQGGASSWPMVPPGSTMLLSLSSAYKVDEPTFALWMSVLRQLPRAVLVLVQHLPSGAGGGGAGTNATEAVEWRARARVAAASHGVLPTRLLFARGVGRQRHRWRLALPPARGGPALALDTPAYNGGATALDLLAARVPLLSLQGARRVVTRMASAIIGAAAAVGGGVDESSEGGDEGAHAALALTAHSLRQYEASAVRLARPLRPRGAAAAVRAPGGQGCLAAAAALRRALVRNATAWVASRWAERGMEPLLAATWEVRRLQPGGMHVMSSTASLHAR